MVIYLDQYNETMWHSKKYHEQSMNDGFSDSWCHATEYDSSIMQNALDICEAMHDKDYIHAGEAMARLMQVYEDARDEFYNNFSATEECDQEQMKKEIAALLDMGYTWGDEECDAED